MMKKQVNDTVEGTKAKSRITIFNKAIILNFTGYML